MATALIGQQEFKVGTTSEVKASVQFLTRVNPGMSSARMRALLPTGTTFSRPTFVPPVDGSFPGNTIRFSGKINGVMTFLSRSQRTALGRGAAVTDRAFRPTDTVHGIQVWLRQTRAYDKARSKAVLDLVSKELGRPNATPEFLDGWANDFGGWSAEWKLNGLDVLFSERSVNGYAILLEMRPGAAIPGIDD